MATLEGINALFPDNKTGAIDAADLRAAFTALWEMREQYEAALTQQYADLETQANYLMGGLIIVPVTQAEYDALQTPDPNVAYAVTG